jgi:hypothetical protein
MRFVSTVIVPGEPFSVYRSSLKVRRQLTFFRKVQQREKTPKRQRRLISQAATLPAAAHLSSFFPRAGQTGAGYTCAWP